VKTTVSNKYLDEPQPNYIGQLQLGLAGERCGRLHDGDVPGSELGPTFSRVEWRTFASAS
jgi:hypothetical protein